MATFVACAQISRAAVAVTFGRTLAACRRVASRSHADSRTGTLYVVATPIGNLGDVSARAATALAGSPLLAAESVHVAESFLGDSRSPGQRILSCHAHNEAERVPELLEALRSGDDVALLSKGGTPAMCDPGSTLVAAAHRSGIQVQPLPGPCSVTAALSVSGLPATRLLFDGYLPALRSVRLRRLRLLASLVEVEDSKADVSGAADSSTVGAFNLAAFCDGAGLGDALEDVESAVGSQAQTCIAKDLSMPHERVMTGSARDVRERWLQLPVEAQRGAIVLLVALPAPPPEQQPALAGGVAHPPPPPSSSGAVSLGELPRVAQLLLKSGVAVQKAALLAAQLTGEPVAKAQQAVQQEALRAGPTGARNVADAMPAQAGADAGSGVAQQTLHLVNIGRLTSKEEVVAALAQIGASSGDLSLADTHLGGKIAFVRFATPEAASRARGAINLAGLRLGGGKPVLAGWARRDRWLS